MRRLIGAVSAAILIAACGSQLEVFPDDATTQMTGGSAGVGGSKGVGGSNGSPMEAGMDALMEVAMPDTFVPDTFVPETSIDSPMEVGMDVIIPSVDAPMCPPGNVAPVNLGTAGNFAILAKSGISTVPASMITGNIGVSPIAATAITGFSLTPCTGTCPFSTSTQVVGEVFAADYGAPSPAMMTTAVGDMAIAISDASGRAPTSAATTELGAGNIGSLTLAPGVYKWSTGVTIPTSVTLQGGCGDVWIFEIAQGLTMASAQSVILSGGALASNVFWQVTGAVDVGANSHFNGTILCATAITMETGSSVNGSLLAQTAVNLQQAIVVKQ